MNILMITNTYLPFIGGVERSVELFTNQFRSMGHRVLIVAPRFEQMPEGETDVIRVPAIQKFNGTDFSIQLPIPGVLNSTLKHFRPDIVHSHHPFMMGDSALRVAAQFKAPIVYTFHTYYERYTHYVPGDSPALKRFVAALATGYANLCDHVFAPSHSVRQELLRRGVSTCVSVVPTGIELGTFSRGEREVFRSKMGIPPEAMVVGFVSRLAPEKNIGFLARSVKRYMEKNNRAYFLLIGSGPSEEEIRGVFDNDLLMGRFLPMGTIVGQSLIDAYHAMDVFVFTSYTETQGLVVTEAMAAGVPVVAVNAPGIAEVVTDFRNGRLLESENTDSFCEALEWVGGLRGERLRAVREYARTSVAQFSKEECALKAISIYSFLLSKRYMERDHNESAWARAKRLIKAEFGLLKNMTRATGAAMGDGTE